MNSVRELFLDFGMQVNKLSVATMKKLSKTFNKLIRDQVLENYTIEDFTPEIKDRVYSGYLACKILYN